MLYINDIHILIYIIFAVVGFGIGVFLNWCAKRMPECKKVFSKEILLECKAGLNKSHYLLGLINSVLYIILLCKFGIGNSFISNFELIQYLILVPMLILAFVIDVKLTIIPNRLNLTLFEVGLVVCFVYGVSNSSQAFNQALDSVFGMLAGGGIFLLLNTVGALIAGKEAMGMGDVKLMGALGLFFGLVNTIVITAVAFLIAAVIGIAVIVYRKNKNIKDSYIPFGPFIVASTIITILVPNTAMINILLKTFTLGMY